MLLAVGLSLLTSLQDETLGVRVREWIASMEGTVQGDPGLDGLVIQVDVDSELGMGRSEPAHELQVYATIPILGRLYAGTWRAGFEGDEILSRDITYGGVTFQVSTQVKSALDLEVYYLSYEFVLPLPMSLGESVQAEVGATASIRGVRAAGQVEGAGRVGTDHGAMALPTFGVHAALQVTPWVRADMEVLGLPVEYGGNRVTYVETYFEVVAQPLPWLFGGFGYKASGIDLHVERSGAVFDVDLSIGGPYFVVGGRF